MSQKIHETQQNIQEYFDQLEEAARALQQNFAGIQEAERILKNLVALLEKNTQAFRPYLGNTNSGKVEYTPKLETIRKDLRTLALHPDLEKLIPEVHGPILLEWLKTRREVEAIYTNRKDGTFIFSHPPAALANAKVRPWWQRAIAGEECLSEIYISAITRQPCCTIALPLRNHEKHIIGVLAIDIALSHLES